MDSEYYRNLYKYSNHKEDSKDFEDDTLKPKNTDNNIFRFYGKCNFDDFDKFFLKEHNWGIAHALTNRDKNILKTHPGYKDYKETVQYKGPQGYTIMHRNYEIDIHKLIIHPHRLENYDDSIKVIKNMFELGLGITCYPENNLPEELAQKIKKGKESKLISKIN